MRCDDLKNLRAQISDEESVYVIGSRLLFPITLLKQLVLDRNIRDEFIHLSNTLNYLLRYNRYFIWSFTMHVIQLY